jgi:hypothetical protein
VAEEAIMTHRALPLLRVGLLSGALVGFSACATTEDVDAVRAQFSATSTSMKHQIEALQKQVQSEEQRTVALHKQVQAEEQKSATQERDLQDLRQAVHVMVDRQRTWGQELDYLRAAVQDKESDLQSMLAAQESVYREGLRSIDAIRRHGARNMFTGNGGYGPSDIYAGDPGRRLDPRLSPTASRADMAEPRYAGPDPREARPDFRSPDR